MEHCVYMIKTGSQAYGLANEKSDTDLLSVWKAPTEERLRLFNKPKEVRHSDKDGVDVKEYELEKFFTMAFGKYSVNAIEFLFTDSILQSSPMFDHIRSNRGLILHQRQWVAMKGQMLNMLDSAQKQLDKKNPQAAGKEVASAMRIYQIASDVFSGLEPVINLEDNMPNFCHLLRKVKYKESSKDLQQRIETLRVRVKDEAPTKQLQYKDLPEDIDKEAVNKLFYECLVGYDEYGTPKA